VLVPVALGQGGSFGKRSPARSAAASTAVERFGGIDVLVNNAASFEAGFFEELTPSRSSASSR
jgi:NAD(P)-dependent dehydrogenase (short-subunit alcohol dehydrogenase family)